MRKVPIEEFVAAVRYSEHGGKPLSERQVLERDEVECQLANMIYEVCSSSLAVSWVV